MQVARVPLRRASVREEYTMQRRGSRRMICWLAVDVPPWVGNPRRTPILQQDLGMPLMSHVIDPTNPLSLEGRPIQQQYHHYKDGKASAMDVTARVCSLGSEIVDFALHQPIRNVGRTCSVANCEFRQNVQTSLGRASKQTDPCLLKDS